MGMPVSPSYPGVYIEEIPLSTIKPIHGVSTSTTAFIGLSKKGVYDEPVLIHNWFDYERFFGGLWSPSHMSYSVKQYFQNGGRDALIIRVVDKSTYGELVASNQDLIFYASNPGSWSKNLKITSDHYNVDNENCFNLTVSEKTEAGVDQLILRYLNLSIDPDSKLYATTTINDTSDHIRIDPNLEYGRPGHLIKFECDNDPRDDTVLTESMILGNGNTTGLYALKEAEIFNLVCIPTFHMPLGEKGKVYREASIFCSENRAILIVDPHQEWNTVEDTAEKPYPDLFPNINATIYFPNLLVEDPLNDDRLIEVAPSGAIAGIFARIDSTKGIWKAPAGLEAFLSSVSALSVDLSDSDIGTLYKNGFNCIRSIPDVGHVVWGARTMLQELNDWKHLSIRRLALYIEESIRRGLRWVGFEPNDEPLWAHIRLNVKSFMHNLFRQGAFQGAQPKEAYYVKCDMDTNTKQVLESGCVSIIIGFAPLRPAEFIFIRIDVKCVPV